MDPLLPPPSVPPHFMAAAVNPITAADFPFAAATEAPVNHIAQAADAFPAATQPPASHPPYAEMIYAAIGALKERDGSSKRAIAKYIERVYTGLPSTHSALLTHHLKHLKNNGLLVLVKKSYKLPGSHDFPPPTTNDFDSYSQPPLAAAQSQPPADAAGDPSLPSSKRGRGRPPKPKPNGHQQQLTFSAPFLQSVVEVNSAAQPLLLAAQLQQPQPQPAAVFPPAFAQPAASEANSNAAQPVWVALGLADEQPNVAKRRPGRPKKLVAQGGLVVAKKARGRPPKSGLAGPKKNPGRPRKPKSVSALSGVKRGPGRPSKAQPLSVAVTYATGGNVVGMPRPRGRPKKTAGGAAGVGAILLPAKRAGRPPNFGGIKKPKKSTGRPVGRPKKNANVSWGATEVPHPHSQAQTEANADLKRKLEFFQSRVGQAIGELRPLLTSETEISAIAAFQELEGLAAMDINAPFREETQPLQIPS